MPDVVIGIGNVFRRDDGIGPAVAQELVRQGIPNLRVLTCVAEPTAILDAWHEASRAVLVDAAAGGEPGRVSRCMIGDLAEAAPLSSHDLSLRQAYDLARALGRAPESVAVVSIEVADTGHGEGMTAPVRAALPQAVRAVLDILGHPGEEPADQQP